MSASKYEFVPLTRKGDDDATYIEIYRQAGDVSVEFAEMYEADDSIAVEFFGNWFDKAPHDFDLVMATFERAAARLKTVYPKIGSQRAEDHIIEPGEKQ